MTDAAAPHFHHVDVVLSVAGPALGWLLAARLLGRPELFFPFAVALAVHLGAFELARLHAAVVGRSIGRAALVCGARAWVLVFVPFVLLQRLDAPALEQAAWALPAIVLGVAGLFWSQHSAGKLPTSPRRWAYQAGWALLASLATAVPLLVGW